MTPRPGRGFDAPVGDAQPAEAEAQPLPGSPSERAAAAAADFTSATWDDGFPQSFLCPITSELMR